jgi:hypothetical protein
VRDGDQDRDKRLCNGSQISAVTGTTLPGSPCKNLAEFLNTGLSLSSSGGEQPGLTGSSDLLFGAGWACFACECRCARRFRSV